VASEEINLEEIKKDIERLAQSNKDKARGIPGEIDLAGIALIKLEVFIDTFLDEGARLVFERNYQIRMKAELEKTLKVVREAQLMQGVGNVNPAKLFVPGQ